MTNNKKNTGYWNTGGWNTGNGNTGDWNTGGYNTGDYNSGYSNTGSKNTGNENTGSKNTGNYNTGNRNTGYWNTGNWNTGCCNTVTPEDCLIFNKPAKRKDWENAEKPLWMRFDLTKWADKNDMTDKEKEDYPSYKTTGGYLKIATSYKQAAKESWNNTSQEDRELTLKLPNFDDKVFEEIFGFSAIKELGCKKRTITIDGKDIEISEESYQELKKSLKE